MCVRVNRSAAGVHCDTCRVTQIVRSGEHYLRARAQVATVSVSHCIRSAYMPETKHYKRVCICFFYGHGGKVSSVAVCSKCLGAHAVCLFDFRADTTVAVGIYIPYEHRRCKWTAAREKK